MSNSSTEVPEGLVLEESGFFETAPSLPAAWTCTFTNNGTMPIDVKATALCLMPGA
jgi:hypothetical protein